MKRRRHKYLTPHDKHRILPTPQQQQQHTDDEDEKKSDYNRFWELLYNSDCGDNPILQTLCQTGLELITTAKQQRQTCDLLLVQHLTLENTPPPQKKARVEQMIKLAKTMGQTDFSITDIRRFYDILAPPPLQDPTDTSRRYRRRKRPAPAPKRRQDDTHQQQQEQHQQDTEDTHGGEVA